MAPAQRVGVGPGCLRQLLVIAGAAGRAAPPPRPASCQRLPAPSSRDRLVAGRPSWRSGHPSARGAAARRRGGEAPVAPAACTMHQVKGHAPQAAGAACARPASRAGRAGRAEPSCACGAGTDTTAHGALQPRPPRPAPGRVSRRSRALLPQPSWPGGWAVPPDPRIDSDVATHTPRYGPGPRAPRHSRCRRP